MPIQSTPPVTDAHAVYAQSIAPYLAAVSEIVHEAAVVEAYMEVGGPAPIVGGIGQAAERLAEIIRETQQHADLVGRRDTLKAADRLARTGTGGGGGFVRTPPMPPAPGGAPLPEPTPEPLPRVPFTEAVGDMLAREPRLAQTAEEVAAAYNEQHGFALARASSLEATKRVKDSVARILHTGQPLGAAVKSVRGLVAAIGEDLADWTRAYTETALHTNIATAYSAGRFRQMAEPAVAYAIGALMFDGPDDDSARPNHVAALGLIAAPDDPVWDALAPPLGFRAVEAGALVSTERGDVPIEDVRVGDRVWTFQSEYAQVYGVDAKVERSRMVTLSIEGNAALALSPEHPVLTRRGWVAAGKLRAGDEVAVTGCKHCGKPVTSWREFCGVACRNRALGLAKRARTEATTVLCGQCASPLRVTPCQRGGRRYCSRACKDEAQRDHRRCRVCDMEIPAHGKKKPHLVCGVKCRAVMRKSIADRPCGTCGRSLRALWVARGAAKRDADGKRRGRFGLHRDRKFCSFRCWRRFNGETSIERTVREYLEAQQIAYVQSEQIGRYEVDFLLPQYAVAVECDGTYWHSTQKVKDRDARKDAFLASEGIVVVRIPEQAIKAGAGLWQGGLYAVCEAQVRAARGTLGEAAQPRGVAT